jgi:hypothetical protein
MKLLLVFSLVLSSGLYAQRGSGRSGYGVRGAGRSGPVGPAVVRYPAYVSGYYPVIPYYGGYATAPAPGPDGYVSGPGYYGYDPSQAAPGQGYPPQGNAGQGYVGQGDPSQGYPSVIVNPNYTPETANPVLRDYSDVPAPQQDSQAGAANAPSVFFLIALKDHTIYPALAYWVEDNTLNYITTQGARNAVPLDQVDRNFSTQLNKERNIDFALPPSK